MGTMLGAEPVLVRDDLPAGRASRYGVDLATDRAEDVRRVLRTDEHDLH
jgi:hypothetical protein